MKIMDFIAGEENSASKMVINRNGWVLAGADIFQAVLVKAPFFSSKVLKKIYHESYGIPLN